MSQLFDESLKEYQANQEYKFEEQVVKRVLKRYRLQKTAKFHLLRACKRKTGNRWIRFVDFYDRFPSFPVLLDARSLSHVARNLSIPDLFKKFDYSPLSDAYEETCESYSGRKDGQPVGLVFAWPYCGPLVIHGAMMAEKTPALRMEWQGADAEPVVIQTFDSFLKDIDLTAGGRWNPNL